MTLGTNGWGSRRKLMALVHEIMSSELKDQTLVAYGGAYVGLLCAASKVKKHVFAKIRQKSSWPQTGDKDISRD